MTDRVLVAGAGVFGMHLAREILRRTDAVVVLAARRADRLEKAAETLVDPNRVQTRTLDLSDPRALREAAAGCAVVACAAGPFDTFSRDLPRVSAETGAHWVDLADEPGWVLGVLADDAVWRAARASGVSVLPGRSTLPALSCALVAWAVLRLPGAYRASITLTIGNKNPKGAAAIGAAIAGEFRQPVPVSTPFGPLIAWRFESPDRALLEPAIHADVRVALEWQQAGWIVASAGKLPRRLRMPFARTAEATASLVSAFGTDGGAVQAEVFNTRGGRAAAALAFPQPVAVAPAAQAIASILRGDAPRTGVVSPLEWPGASTLITDAVGSGARFLTR
jgi:hypothetical protein